MPNQLSSNNVSLRTRYSANTMLTNLPNPRFIADSILFDSDFLQCIAVAMVIATIWASIHLSSDFIELLFQFCSPIPLCLLEVITISVDFVLGKGVSKETLSVTRQYLFNQSVQMFLFPIRIIRYCCPLRCFPQVCDWIHIMNNGIDHEFVAGFIYHFMNIGTCYSGCLYAALSTITPVEGHHVLCFSSDIKKFIVLFSGMPAMMAIIIWWKPLLQEVEEAFFGASTVIRNIKFYIRNLKVEVQRILFVYTMNDQLDEARARRKSFQSNVHHAAQQKVPTEMIDLILKFDSKGTKEMMEMIETAEMHEFPYYADYARERAQLHFVTSMSQHDMWRFRAYF